VDSSLQLVYAFKEGVGFDYHCTEEGRGMTPPEIISDGPFQLKLSPIKAMDIKVVNENGEPIPLAKVRAWLIGKAGEKSSFNTVDAPDFFVSLTNEEGIATLQCLPEWTIERTSYSALGPQDGVVMPNSENKSYFGHKSLDWNKLLEKTEIPTFVLPKLARAKGTVKLADGTPVAWATITRSDHAVCGHGIRFTDANGEFELLENANVKLDLAVDESKFGATPGIFAFDMGDGTSEKTLDFVIEKGIRMHGTVYGLDGKPTDKEFSVLIYEKDPNPEPVLCDPEDEDCETCDTGNAIVIRQTSNYGKDVLDGKYEYILPAVKRDYSISASVYSDEGYASYEFTLTGNEEEYEFDLHLKVEEEKEATR